MIPEQYFYFDNIYAAIDEVYIVTTSSRDFTSQASSNAGNDYHLNIYVY